MFKLPYLFHRQKSDKIHFNLKKQFFKFGKIINLNNFSNHKHEGKTLSQVIRLNILFI